MHDKYLYKKSINGIVFHASAKQIKIKLRIFASLFDCSATNQ